MCCVYFELISFSSHLCWPVTSLIHPYIHLFLHHPQSRFANIFQWSCAYLFMCQYLLVTCIRCFSLYYHVCVPYFTFSHKPHVHCVNDVQVKLLNNQDLKRNCLITMTSYYLLNSIDNFATNDKRSLKVTETHMMSSFVCCVRGWFFFNSRFQYVTCCL